MKDIFVVRMIATALRVKERDLVSEEVDCLGSRVEGGLNVDF